MIAASPLQEMLDRLLDPISGALTPEVAKAIVKLRADKATQKQLDDYAERHHEGELTPEELSQYEALVEAISLISVLQAKARLFLKSHKPS
jgi:hypothetical protein